MTTEAVKQASIRWRAKSEKLAKPKANAARSVFEWGTLIG